MTKKQPERQRDWLVHKPSLVDLSYIPHELQSSEDREDWAEFQEFYFSLVAVVERHFGPDLDHHSIAHRIWHQAEISFREMWSKSAVEEDLIKLKTRLFEISGILESLPEAVDMAMRTPAMDELKQHLKAFQEWQYNPDPNRAIEETPSWEKYLMLHQIRDTPVSFVPLIEAALEVAHKGEPVGNKALSEWRVVDAAALVCSRPGSPISVPKALNPTSPFARFLEDVFDLYDLKGDPASAFRGWRKYVDRVGSKNHWSHYDD